MSQPVIVETSLKQLLPHLDVSKLAGKRMFITGGTGFFGLWMLSALSLLNQQGADIAVTVLSRNPEQFLDTHREWYGLHWLSFIQGNVRNFEYPEARYDLLIQAASETSAVDYVKPLAFFDDIVLGTRHVLDFAVQSGVKRVLLVSSGAVYGPQPNDISHIPEDAHFACPTDAITSAYGESKRMMELLGTIYYREYGIEPVIARCFAFVGPELLLDRHFAIGNFIRDALYANTIHVSGDGTSQRSYLYMADLSVWLLDLLANGTAGFAYNVGSDQSISIAELACLVRDVLAPEKEVVITQQPSADGIRHRYIPDISRARGELELDVWTRLDKAIELTGSYRLSIRGLL